MRPLRTQSRIKGGSRSGSIDAPRSLIVTAVATQRRDMTDINVDGNTIVIDGTEHALRRPVEDILEIDGVVVVLLKFPNGGLDPTNVLGFSSDGEKLWEIGYDIEHPQEIDTYVRIREKEGELWASLFADANHRVDPETGEILEKEQVR